jgi:hypothetical protein
VEVILAVPHEARSSFAAKLIGLNSTILRRFISSLLPEHRFAAFGTLILDAPTNAWMPNFLTLDYSVVGIEKVRPNELGTILLCIGTCLGKEDKAETAAESRYLTASETKAVFDRVLTTVLAQNDVSKFTCKSHGKKW